MLMHPIAVPSRYTLMSVFLLLYRRLSVPLHAIHVRHRYTRLRTVYVHSNALFWYTCKLQYFQFAGAVVRLCCTKTHNVAGAQTVKANSSSEIWTVTSPSGKLMQSPVGNAYAKYNYIRLCVSLQKTTLSSILARRQQRTKQRLAEQTTTSHGRW